jgi:hypothetical protein
MAAYGGNNLCVRFQVNPIEKPLPENKSEALPAHSPRVATAMPGGKETSVKSRYPKSMKTLPNPWHQRNVRRKRKGVGRLMGE